MQTFMINSISQIEAVRFLDKKNLPEMVRLCTEYDGKIHAVPRDLLGTPRSAFYAVKNEDSWEKINLGDWIVKKDDNYAVLPNGIFNILFTKLPN